MVENEIDAVRTKPAGFAPILKHYFEKARIAEIIDENVNIDPRRKVLIHCEGCVAMTTAILFQVLQLYRLCKFAEDTTILETILPGIDPKEYFDDRLADTLDAIYDCGLGNLEMAATKNMIEDFEIETDICHNDTTTGSLYGDCDAGRKEDSVKITFGYSKKHRQDLKQFIWSLSVAGDHAFALFQQACDGNTSDVDTYVEQWSNLVDLPGREDFSIEDAMTAHKNQYKVEHTNRRAKSGYDIEPIYLHTPKRIESYLFLFKMALQIVVLIERTPRRNIEAREKGLEGFMPNQKDVRNPKTEYLLAEFQYGVKGEVPLPNGNFTGFVSN